MSPHLSTVVAPICRRWQLNRVFETAHSLVKAAWPNAGGAGTNRFHAEKLAMSVIRFVHSPEKGNALEGAAAGIRAKRAEQVSITEFKGWVSAMAPLLHHCLSTFMNTRCFLYGDMKAKGLSGASKTKRHLNEYHVAETTRLFAPCV